MQSNNQTDDQGDEKQTFIGTARREQIIEAAIAVLNDVGFTGTSLAKIAQQAGISTALISYYFANKRELMEAVLGELVMSTIAQVGEEVEITQGYRDKLRRYIEVSVRHVCERPKEYVALLEIVFNARSADGDPIYKEDGEHPAIIRLENLLSEGQKHGEFRQFNAHAMSLTISAAINQYAQYSAILSRFEREPYLKDLVETFDIATRK